MENVYYTVDEIANLLKVHRNTVIRWINTGKLKTLKTVRSYRIKHQDLQNFLTIKK